MERDRDSRGDGEGGAGGDRANLDPKGNLLAGNGSGGNTVVRDFLEGRRGRGSTARRNPAVTHGRIELFIVMAGCSASLCVGVGRVRGPPVRGRILSLLLLLLSTIIPSSSPRRSRSLHSFFSPLDFGIYKYRYRASPLLYNTAALLLRRALSILLRHHSLPPCPPSCSPSPSRPFHSPRPSLAASSSSLLSQGPSATCATGRPLPVYTPLGVQHLPTWPRHNCIRTRPTVDPVHTPRLPASTTVTTGTALNLSPRTTLLHYFERLIRNYYLNRDTNG